jgi:hypothetical protein
MPASDPASILNQNRTDLGIPNRFNPKESDSRLEEAVTAFGDALAVFEAAGAEHYVTIAQTNLAQTQVLIASRQANAGT